jgi:entericidin B
VAQFPKQADPFSLILPNVLKSCLFPSISRKLATLKVSYFTFSYRKEIYMLKKSILAILSVLILSSALTACNTTRGVGEDVSAGGEAIQKSAQ